MWNMTFWSQVILTFDLWGEYYMPLTDMLAENIFVGCFTLCWDYKSYCSSIGVIAIWHTLKYYFNQDKHFFKFQGTSHLRDSQFEYLWWRPH